MSVHPITRATRPTRARAVRGPAVPSVCDALEPRRLLATFVVTSKNPAGDGSLRQAVDRANANPGPDEIKFDIDGELDENGEHVIDLRNLSPGDPITVRDTVVIDGYTQGLTTPTLTDDATPNTLPEDSNARLRIRLQGSDTRIGLHFFGPRAKNSEVKGLIFADCVVGIIAGADGLKVEGNFFDGNAIGVSVNANHVSIGRSDAASRNVLFGNGAAIRFGDNSGSGTLRGNVMRDNRVGVEDGGRRNVIGGSGVFGGNVIFGSEDVGIRVLNSAEDTEIHGNSVTDGNGGVEVGERATGVVLGGNSGDPYQGNRIALNDLFGVFLRGLVTNRLNSIHDNGGGNPGGRIRPAGQPAGAIVPTLVSATTTPAGTAVSGSISNALPGDRVAVDIHGSHDQGESEVFVETIDVVAGPNGDASFNATVLASGMRYVTAYATGGGGTGGTSPLSNAVENARPPVLTVTNADGSQNVAGSYPFALKQAAMTPGPEVIEFAIPNLAAAAQIAAVLVSGPPPQVIELKDLIIDGTTQGGGGLVPRIYIVGSGVDLHFVTSGVTIFGLGFANARGIDLEGSPFGGEGFNRITRNFLGVSPAGAAVIPPLDTRAIVRIFGDRNIVDNNLIHNGRGLPGIWSFGGSFNRIESNRIGVNLEGQALPGNGYGIQLARDGVSGDSDGNTIRNNVIANAQQDAVSIVVGDGNDISGNTMFGNGGQGIDLGDDGPTANDAGDGDAGPNNLQNFPVLNSAEKTNSTRIAGTLNSAASRAYRLDFYATSSTPAADADEGRTYLGSATVNTNGAGNVSFDVTVPGTVEFGDRVLATATDPGGNTSEFSATVAVTDNTPPTVTGQFDQQPDQTVLLSFSEDVSASLVATDLAVRNLDTNTDVPSEWLTLFYADDDNKAFFGFGGAPGGALPPGNYRATLPRTTVSDAAGNAPAADFVLNFQASAGVADRHVFYNNSFFDGNSLNATALDDGAIAPNKAALLPRQTATEDNYTDYSRGINGVMVDIGVLGAATPTAADFMFRVGNDNTPDDWAAAPNPTVTVRRGDGVSGTDRVTLTWPDNTIRATWLQVTVRATAPTGLAEPDVFYFGNLPGDTFNSTTTQNFLVNSLDVQRTRINQFQQAPITSLFDHDKSNNIVNSIDLQLSRINQFTTLNRITVSSAAAALRSPPAAAPTLRSLFPPATAAPPRRAAEDLLG